MKTLFNISINFRTFRLNDIFGDVNTLILDIIVRFRPLTTTIAIAAGVAALAMALISKRQRSEVKEELLNILLIVLAIAGMASAVGLRQQAILIFNFFHLMKCNK